MRPGSTRRPRPSAFSTASARTHRRTAVRVLPPNSSTIAPRRAASVSRGTRAGSTSTPTATPAGAIDLQLEFAQDVEARTSNGSIDHVVPDGSYRVDAETSYGRTDIAVPNDSSGEYTLDLSTSNGSITVESSSS